MNELRERLEFDAREWALPFSDNEVEYRIAFAAQLNGATQSVLLTEALAALRDSAEIIHGEFCGRECAEACLNARKDIKKIEAARGEK